MRKSKLKGIIYRKVGLGEAATHGQEIAQAATEDGAEGLSDLAAIGSNGRWKQTCQRDLFRLARRDQGVDSASMLHWVETVGRRRGTFASECVQVPMLPPHEFAGQLWKTDEDRFHALMGTQHLRDFWSHLLKTRPAWFVAHPAFRGIERTGGVKHIPYRVFGDDGGLGKERSIEILHWSPVLHHEGGVRLTRKCRIPIFIVDDGLSIKGCTEVPLMKAVAWSFNEAFHGVYTNRDEHGNEAPKYRRRRSGSICGGYKLVFIQLCADWKYLNESIQSSVALQLRQCMP